jgi:peptide/nickel transport system substrate-binding protein
VAFTINYLIEKQAPLYAPKLESVRSTSVQGNRVTIRLKAPSASFIPVTLSTMPILPRHVWADVEDPAAFANNSPVGSGPFRFEARQLGSALRLQANQQYFRPPQADGIVWATFGSLDAEIGALQQGEIDILGDFVSVSQLDALEDAEGVRVAGRTSHGWNGVHFNMTREPFNDRHFRRALAALVPVRDIQQIVLAGSGVAAGSVIAPNLDWHDPGLGAFPRGTQRAKAELEKAGYVMGPDQRLYYPPADQDQRVTQPTS